MKHYFIILIYLLISNFLTAQQPSSQIEINPYIRHDTYHEFLEPPINNHIVLENSPP